MSHTIKYLFFDLDDTLIPSQKIYQQALVEMGLSLDSGAYLEARKRVKADLPELHVCARNRMIYFKRMQEGIGLFSPKLLLDQIRIYEEKVSDLVQKYWVESGRQSFFETLARKYSIVVVTNEGLRIQAIKLHAMDPESKWLTALVTSEEVGEEKPSHVPFLKALEIVAAKPSECLMIGDSWESDLKPAAEIGMSVLHSREFFSAGHDLGKVRQFSTMVELSSILEEIA